MIDSKEKRQDTKCESEGAEFLVLGSLMINRIWAYKAYTNMAGYDLIALNPESGKNCKIQVKSRWATDSNKSFSIKNTDCDFVVYINLNRGFWYNKIKRDDKDGIKAPDIFIIPIDIIKTHRSDSTWMICNTRKIENLHSFRENWKLISDFLAK